MSETTSRFEMPFILPGQAQKELFHNEALALIDVALHPAIQDAQTSVPPADPVPGQFWIVGAAASGAWAGRTGSIAAWTAGGWRFVTPPTGMLAWSIAQGFWVHWTGSEWTGGELPVAALHIGGEQVVGPRQPSIASPSGGTIIDGEARAAVTAIIETLMSHGLID